MHFTYDENPSFKELMQGDVLRRTPEMDDILNLVHPHFYKNDKNLYFLVLTQSCDLVPRTGGACKAPYILIAPVRSIDTVISKHLRGLANSVVRAELPVISHRGKTKATEFLGRLLNNNEPGLFYLESEGTNLRQDCVAVLNLSIALKSDLHYYSCLAAKILQLDQTFQAKLGWLVGQLYSRVGTADWDPGAASSKINLLLKDAAIWVEDSKVAALEKAYIQKAEVSPSVELSGLEISAALKQVPNKKTLILSHAERVIRDALGEEREKDVARLLSRLRSDAGLSALLK